MTTKVEYKKPKLRKHRIVKSSGVDESLFGAPARLQQMSGNRTWTGSTETERQGQGMGRGKRVSTDPQVMQLVTKDLIRNLKVPSTPDPSGRSVVLDPTDYGRIIESTKFLSMDDRKQLKKEQKEREHSHMEASNRRKREMQEYEYTRKRNEKPSDIEQEKMEKESAVAVNATLLLEEQDDEIKKINEFVLNAKCHAIRDSQLKEKSEIASSMQEEEARLDTMMEVERVKAVENYDKTEQEIQLQRYKGAEVIQQQIKNREQQRLLDLEKKDQETQAMLQYLERLQGEDLQALLDKKTTQKALMEEVIKCNDEMQVEKARDAERMKLENMKALEYVKEKIRQEEESQADMERQKVEKEREIARMRAQQERAKDKQAERDAVRAKRRQEEFERIARKKEKEEAEKKRRTEAMLIHARHEQVQHKEHFLALQALQDRKEFERVLQTQKDKIEEDRDKCHTLSSLRHTHAQEIRKQVRDKEEEKIKARKNFFEEGRRLDQETKARKRKLDEIKFRKLAELKEAGVPDKYCAEVSRRITAPPPSFTMSGMH